jgi:hypothetical protein
MQKMGQSPYLKECCPLSNSNHVTLSFFPSVPTRLNVEQPFRHGSLCEIRAKLIYAEKEQAFKPELPNEPLFLPRGIRGILPHPVESFPYFLVNPVSQRRTGRS